jgi:hypothetical protein
MYQPIVPGTPVPPTDIPMSCGSVCNETRSSAALPPRSADSFLANMNQTSLNLWLSCKAVRLLAMFQVRPYCRPIHHPTAAISPGLVSRLSHVSFLPCIFRHSNSIIKWRLGKLFHKLNPAAWVHDRTIPTERQPLVGEISANVFWDRGCHFFIVTDFYGRILGFLDRKENCLWSLRAYSKDSSTDWQCPFNVWDFVVVIIEISIFWVLSFGDTHCFHLRGLIVNPTSSKSPRPKETVSFNRYAEKHRTSGSFMPLINKL